MDGYGPLAVMLAYKDKMWSQSEPGCLGQQFPSLQTSAHVVSSVWNAVYFLFIYSFYRSICLPCVGYLGEMWLHSNHCWVSFHHKLGVGLLHNCALRHSVHNVSYDGTNGRKVKNAKIQNNRNMIEAYVAQVHLKCYFELENAKEVSNFGDRNWSQGQQFQFQKAL